MGKELCYLLYIDVLYHIYKKELLLLQINALKNVNSLVGYLELSSIFLILISLQPRSQRPLLFQTKNYVRSMSQSLKYQRFTPSGFKDILIKKLEFSASIQFL